MLARISASFFTFHMFSIYFLLPAFGAFSKSHADRFLLRYLSGFIWIHSAAIIFAVVFGTGFGYPDGGFRTLL